MAYVSKAHKTLGIVLSLLLAGCGRLRWDPAAFVIRQLPAVAGARVESSMVLGVTDIYEMNFPAGFFADLGVEQKGIDVAVKVTGPDGRQLAASDSLYGNRGWEPVPIVTEQAGRYLLEVRARATPLPARYEVRLAALRPATARDRARVAAESHFAVAAFPQALAGFRALGERGREADVLYSMACAGFDLGRAKEALALFRSLGREREAGRALNDLGRLYRAQGDSARALATYREALALNRRLGEGWAQAVTLQGLGMVYRSSGETGKAIEHYEEALALWRRLGDRLGEARTLATLGDLYQSVGDPQRALDRLEPALALLASAGRPQEEASALTSLGDALSRKGEGPKAVAVLERALAIERRNGDREGEARTLNDLGWVYILLHDWRHVRESFARARALYREAGDRPAEAVAVANVAWADAEAGRLQAAIAGYGEALPLLAAFGDRDAEASALLGLALARRALSDLAGAQAAVEQGIERVESLRGTSASLDLRAAFLASKQQLYAFEVDLLMERNRRQPGSGWDAQALAAAERARARGLLDLLAESGADLRRGVDSTLLARVDAADHRVNEADRLRWQLQSSGAEQALRHALADADCAQTELRLASPAYAALTQPHLLSVPEIQRQVLDGDTLLLEYHLGRDRSFLWAVTADTLTAFELPRRAEIEDAARHGYELLERSRETLAQRPAEEALAELSNLLLKPVAGLLGGKRLLIVPDGALHYLPFGALPIPGSSEPLVAAHEVVTSPSASALAVARRELDGRPPAPRTLAVVADPVFDAGDPRVSRRLGGATVAWRGSSPRGGDRFQRLGYSHAEAAALAALVPPDERLDAVGFKASRETVLSGALARYRIVHFATHGLLDTGNPGLSKLVLSQIDEQGRPRNGFVWAHEIYGLKLPADLVVLSACHTALGPEIRGEGLVGLTRGFQYAGARAVLVSLWEVDDEATAELMRLFYREMLERGQAPAAALRSAQDALRRRPEWNAPYFWAGFILQGDWRRPANPRRM
ncbi:MAG TPA: CHAT domain-containing protein [Thermoanaerobaculia bacterium]|jgi:CHAT domain-containing protein/tetratricopeptide (TPR) repeat protein|nr:CHAT domain-containing protein [Thermoanaerobaculia bacterium]